jgi:hypothetical protein
MSGLAVYPTVEFRASRPTGVIGRNSDPAGGGEGEESGMRDGTSSGAPRGESHSI